MYLRAHISVFAIGCVILLGIDLLGSSGGVWADTAIGAWGMLIVVHAIVLIIARLLLELLGDDEDQPIRPASEMQWHTPSTWTLPPRTQPTQEAPAPSTSSSESGPGAPGKEATERVSWQAATNAAWLAPRDTTPDEQASSPAPDNPPAGVPRKRDDDFTPLKLD